MSDSPVESRRASLELGVIGNGSIAALVDDRARIVWCCLPRFDADASFCALLSPKGGGGDWAIELEDFQRAEQHYLPNTAVLVTRMFDRHGGVIEVVDFAPRHNVNGRLYHPVTLARKVNPLSGSPRIRVLMRPLCEYGAAAPKTTSGSNHIRYLLSDTVQRLTSDVSTPMIERGLAFGLERPAHFVFGPDETLGESPAEYIHQMLERTASYWYEWSRYLAVPYEWQEPVIRAAITLKLCQYEATGAIVAALTTSIPESDGSSRNWDYRYCWLRDAAFTVRAMNRLGVTRSMEEYIHYVFNVIAADGEAGGDIGPVFGITFERELHERQVDSLAGYRGMGPVRVGNDAWRQRQNDVYGSVVLAAAQLFFDYRLEHRGDAADLPSTGTHGRGSPARGRATGRGLVGIPRPRGRAYLFGRHVLGRVLPPGAHRHRTGAGRPCPLLARASGDAARAYRGARVEPRTGPFRRCLRRRKARRQPVAARRHRLHRGQRSALRGHRRRHRREAWPG